ncbi:regulator of telomere elongation helicase 1 homolog isoform X1 [Sitophilus oryzae]|uniref:Regulator of telomere elongation helicase 1 homolog n=1 Tax=Sitophilus oryzae TaxID=7048 RepID=A0A6J2XWB6_SITOR|nr:regulator of telomere elongation helicase 1 homolog isoform X1 [Sitophilus oryzae]
MPMIELKGVPVEFPFEPYEIQKNYMEKVIECLQNETTAVLESPTGTGKTLCLLCASLAWLQLKKTQLQLQRSMPVIPNEQENEFLDKLNNELEKKIGKIATGRSFLGLPTIIYASRTHSQLSQAMQELKRSSYSHMRASVLGSRDQLCIHPEVMAEPDRGLRVQMCRMKLATRMCHLYNKVDRLKEDHRINDSCIIDIEDMVKLGDKHKFCPYYMTKELQQRSDIIFAPYNYLLDPIARKALGLNLNNSVVILDEAHNVENVCENSASIEIKASDIALAIEETTGIMKLVSETVNFNDSPQDIEPEELATLKEMLLNFEKALDEIVLNKTEEVNNYPGDFIFELLEKASINAGNSYVIIALIDKVVQFLSTKNDGPFARKGKALQLFSDFLTIVFASKATKEKVKWCYKVHIREEDKSNKSKKVLNSWLAKGGPTKNRILCFWCFSPGFGMDMILSNNIKALILTSGTLAPLKPFISELELKVTVQLENPHIIGSNQICVKILTAGSDGEPLNSSYQNRENPRYISSLGRTIVNLTRIIPNGLLIFFPTYPVMHKCQSSWQEDGIWSSISSQKAIFVEPREKDAFNTAMAGYYEKVRDPSLKGAIFMAVCKGKVSEGLDFTDANGRAVIITGLPYPPLKDARVVLKRRYLDQCHAKDQDYLRGQDWYSLEASRAVNQAIGRVIRHKDDYGAILLLDQRFNNFRIKEQMSKWLRGHITVVGKYSEIIRDLSQFFRNALKTLPAPTAKPFINKLPSTFSDDSYKTGNLNFSTQSSISLSSDSDCSVISNPGCSNAGFDLMSVYTNKENGLVRIYSNKRENSEIIQSNQIKKKKYIVQTKTLPVDEEKLLDPKQSLSEYVAMVKKNLGSNFQAFIDELTAYKEHNDINKYLDKVDPLVPSNLKYIFIGMSKYIREMHKDTFKTFLKRYNLSMPEDL